MTEANKEVGRGGKKAKKHKLSLRPGPVGASEAQLADKSGSCVLNGGRAVSWQAHSRQRQFQSDIQV